MPGHALQVVPITYLQAVILGFFQGLTEFLPVSSTAHMALVPQLLLKMGDPGAAFSAVVQLGPIVAIVSYFRHDLKHYLIGILHHPNPLKIPADNVDARLGWYTVFGTVPLAIFGVLLEKKIDTIFRRPDVIGVSLIVLALILWVAERVGKRDHSLEQITLKESQTIGWMQVLALLPGTSRSGVTITAGLFEGLDRESAARFSFLLSIPAITAAGVFKLYRVLHTTQLGSEVGPYLLAALVACIVAYVVVYLFLDYVKEHNTGIFIGYRIVLGVLVLYLVSIGTLKIPKHGENPIEAQAVPTQVSSPIIRGRG